MPTLAPACHLVPRWRAMMLPGTTTSPPNCFSPRRRPAESRPLREDPPAFLCAIVSLQNLIQVVAQIYDEIISLLFAFAALGGRLRGFLGRSLGGLFRGDLHIVAAEHQHFAELDDIARLAVDAVDLDLVFGGNTVLLAACFNDCEHRSCPRVQSRCSEVPDRLLSVGGWVSGYRPNGNSG